MALKIGTVSKLTGFSPSGIRYYEEKGIINPSHGGNGTYRSFDFEDVALLLECRNLRECGCSTTETVSAITTNDELESVKALRECGKRLRAEIQRKELLEGFLQQRICALESALGKTKTVQVRESPAFYWTPLWLPGKNENVEAANSGRRQRLHYSVCRLEPSFAPRRLRHKYRNRIKKRGDNRWLRNRSKIRANAARIPRSRILPNAARSLYANRSSK